QISDDIKAIIKLDEAIPAPDITQHMAEEAFEHVLVYAGAVIPSRDEIDTRIIYETFTGTAQYGTYYSGGGNGIIDTPSDVGGWPAYNSTTPPADSDHDGMPDDWETANDLNPNDASDRNGDSDADGYTNLEEYLNSLVDNFKYLVRPIHFKIDSTDNNLIYLSWTDISDNETGFIIERSSGEGFNEVASLPANTTTYIDNTITESGFYKYRIKAFNDEIESFYTDSIAVSLNITLFTGNFSSENIDLKINPNPFYDIANISYNITNRTTTHLSIYDLTGKEIACIVNKIQIPGAYHYVLNGNQLENGIYIIKLKTNNSVSFIKILKLK
ncbi:MAG: T9SS type A sorting domain-containing protein, partial [Bacteroidales bacterium]|nr:T9SS type A sorting domain-containing protein [Bacteroidales bacterium]